jgi:hypothetical protein
MENVYMCELKRGVGILGTTWYMLMLSIAWHCAGVDRKVYVCGGQETG